jgi:hypothetical protein
VIICRIVAWFGLYQFKPFAPKLSVIVWICALVWMIFSPGVLLVNTFGSALSNLYMFLSGMILALAFFSPAANWFETNADPPA